MKIDKRITKCIIAATVLVTVIATAPVVSSGSIALAQQPPSASDKLLKVIPINRANCINRVCPGGANMITGVTIGKPARISEKFAAQIDCHGPEACFGPEKQFLVRPGEPIMISADKGTNPNPDYWIFQTPHIVTTPSLHTSNCDNIEAKQCETVMPNYGPVTIDVNYHWAQKETPLPPPYGKGH